MRGLPAANHGVGQGVEQADSPFERSPRFIVRINAAGRRGRAVEIRDRLCRLPRTFIVTGKNARDAIQFVGMERFQRLRHPSVQPAAPRPAQAGVGRLAQLAVAEVVGIISLLTDDPFAPALVETTDEHILAQVAGGGQDAECEGPADHCRQLDQVARLRRKLGQTCFEDLTHLVGQCCLDGAHRGRVARGRAMNLPEAGAHHLHDEQGMSFRALVQQRPQRPVERPARHPIRQRQRGVLA